MELKPSLLSPLKRGDEAHIQGFILNKLYSLKAWVKPGGSPHRHHSITNIKKGYPKNHRGKFDKILKNMQKDGLLQLFPHSGNGELHVCAILMKDVIIMGLEIANKYRVCEGLPPLDVEFREVLLDLIEK